MSGVEEIEEDREEIMEVDSSGDSSEDEDDLLEKRAKELETQISNYIYAYDSHVELVGIYKKLLNLTAMRSAYERFSEHFPLTAKLWLDWIRDEMSVASSENEKKFIISLFEKAVEDYLSVDLWLEYVQYCIGQIGVEETRKTFEKAINAAGLHVTKGSLIWDAYREFELAHLSCIDTENELWQEQAIRVSEVFRRQLSVALLDMERTYIEWRVWAERLPRQDFIKKEQVEYVYKKATNNLEKYQPHEKNILSATTDEERFTAYKNYISDEKEPEHTRCLYERAIADLSLYPQLWLDYCNYFFKLNNDQAALKTSERALRNCPWNEELWVFNMRALEICEKTHDEITQCLEKALTSVNGGPGIQSLAVWLPYLEHFRRITDRNDEKSVEKLRDVFQKAFDYLVEHFEIPADPECTILRFWAKVEAGFLKDMPAARKIWNEYGVLKTLGSAANTWLELIDLENQYGDDKHLIRTYERALSATKDYPHFIVQSWLMYEREFGTAESIMKTNNTCRKHMTKWNLENAQQNGDGEQVTVGKKRKFNQDQKGKEKPKGKTGQESGKERNKFAKNDEKEKKKITSDQESAKDTERKLKQVKISEEIEEEDKRTEEDKKRIEIDSEKQHRSVFISNLDYAVTDDQLREFLGSVEELRLVKDRKGHSKGYAYCVFAKPEEAEKTLSRDREPLNGRPVFISKCKIDKMQREPQFKYSTEQEKHKLFVKGLPLSMTQEQVEDKFKPYGEVKEVRLVTYRNGRSKGLAYVEFINSNDAAKAIIAMDNTEIDDYTISVAISDPPKRKNDSAPVSIPEVRHSKSRLQIPLVPRAIQTAVKSSQPSLSNEDFRKMLSKK